MSLPPRPGATARATPDETASALSRVIANWKPIVMVAAALCGAAAAVVRYDGGVAKKPDVATERAFAADVAKDVRALDKRLTHQEERGEWRDAVLKAIADKVGAIVPPLPPPEP